ncbi:RNA polymerase sigma-70 factor [Dysgonomonas sp. Marseille-P4677]|uniref:RNA polymerase sigma-70 factor n=1 Tax=Dysgonomonas sp. Marseille-P4677 TaxID=2364790 RepID=UPI001911AFA7|nr:RNA polymerase sigma-70 factor [Dysgonomonas sp. Marseille-P4677]MBK5722189.1 RNA polymerase sigma-70 factor [Dysgonomonas sp. Marseille-P4677]
MKYTGDFTDETVLLDELKKGSNDALEFLFKAYYPRLQGYASRFISDKEAVKDIIQECFIKLWEKHESLQVISIQSLLFAMVRNSCLNYLKHCSIVNQYQIEYLANIGGQERLYHADFFCDSDSPLLYEELQREINYVIEQMPERRKEVFLMSRFEGLKNKEIAEKLHISTTAVEKHISKSLQSFEDHFKNKYPIDIYVVVVMWLINNNL